MLSEVDIISSVSGGSSTALAYALGGECLFDQYEQFLKRKAEGELLKRLFNPSTWPQTLSSGFGRSELAEQYYRLRAAARQALRASVPFRKLVDEFSPKEQ